ncbi:hypothetical protein, partial [Streptomyces albus]
APARPHRKQDASARTEPAAGSGAAATELRFVDVTGSREAAGRSIRLLDMARRLPQLVRRSLGLA